MTNVASVRIVKEDIELCEGNSVPWCQPEASLEYDDEQRYSNALAFWGEQSIVAAQQAGSQLGVEESMVDTPSARNMVIGAPSVGYVYITYFLGDHQEGVLENEVKQYSSILRDLLEPLSFAFSEPYEDKLGGRVLDAFNGRERVTLVVDMTGIQVLSCIAGRVGNKIVTRATRMKSEVIEYVGDLLGRGSDAVDAAR